ncbi:hypothetical protein FQZ97_1267780 [compost metagenome]
MVLSFRNSTPNTMPLWRTSPMTPYFMDSSVSAFAARAPILAALACRFRCSISSSTAMAAAQATGLPPNVLKYR